MIDLLKMLIFRSYVKLPEGTPEKSNVAMGNGQFIDDFPIETYIFNIRIYKLEGIDGIATSQIDRS